MVADLHADMAAARAPASTSRHAASMSCSGTCASAFRRRGSRRAELEHAIVHARRPRRGARGLPRIAEHHRRRAHELHVDARPRPSSASARRGSHRGASTGRKRSSPTMMWPLPSPWSASHGARASAAAASSRAMRGKTCAWMSMRRVMRSPGAAALPGCTAPQARALAQRRIAVELREQRRQVAHDALQLHLDAMNAARGTARQYHSNASTSAGRPAVLDHEADAAGSGRCGEWRTCGGSRKMSPARIGTSRGRPSSMIRSTMSPLSWKKNSSSGSS